MLLNQERRQAPAGLSYDRRFAADRHPAMTRSLASLLPPPSLVPGAVPARGIVRYGGLLKRPTLARLKAVFEPALALHQAGELAEAEVGYRHALIIDPRHPLIHNNLGAVLLARGHTAGAQAAFEDAVRFKPDYADAWRNLGALHQQLKRPDGALAAFRRAADLAPDEPEAWHRVLLALRDTRRPVDTEALARELAQRWPADTRFRRQLGVALAAQGRLPEAEAVLADAVAVDPDDLSLRSAAIFFTNYRADITPQAFRVLADGYGTLAARRAKRPHQQWDCEQHPAKLRVGLVSGDLRRHPCGYFLASFLGKVDRSRVEFIAYPTEDYSDDLSERLKPHLAGWYPIAGVDDPAAAAMVKADGVHLLMDLSGHTASNRLALFAHRPAPVAASWLGYFNTTGLEAIDWLLLGHDQITDEVRRCSPEALWDLGASPMCLAEPEADVPVAPLPAASRGHLSFGSFQNLAKINDGCLAAWARVLARLPTARLRVQAPQFDDPAVLAAFHERLAAAGLDAARVDVARHCASHADYLRAFGEVDAILDTFPYPGVTTTCEALWMGVPTLALPRGTPLSRTSGSLLHAAGLGDWVAEDEDDYVAKAVALTADTAALAALRAGLRERAQASRVFDAAGFARDFEHALWGMWAARGPAAMATTPAGASVVG